MRTYEFDAVIIGSGCAGYNAADTLFDLGMKNIAVLTEGKNTGTSRNTGSDKQTYYKLSLSGDEGDSVLKMAETYYAGGAMDGDLALTEAGNSTRAFMKLVNLGVEFPTNAYGEYVGYKTDHDPFYRATSIGPYTSKRMTEVLENSVLRKGITLLDSLQVIRLLKEEDRVTGLLAIDLGNTEVLSYVAVKTPVVVLATGGPAILYQDSVYPPCHTGASSLALDAGADFSNLSEWQYGLASVDFRWNVSGTYQQVLPRYISVDEAGVEREFLSEYMSPGEMLKCIFLKGYEWPFDVRKIRGSSYVDLLVYRESVLKNRKVYMDFTREPSGLEEGFDRLDPVCYDYLKKSDALLPLPIRRLQKMNPGAIRLYREHGIDLSAEPLRIAVCAQHNNGGIAVDSSFRTTVRGLYACGECAGAFGVFRPGGSALNDTQVSSLRAAEWIRFHEDNRPSGNFENILEIAVAETDALLSDAGAAESTVLREREMNQRFFSENFAFIRDVAGMEKAMERIEEKLRSFAEDNRWKAVREIPQLMKNLDLLKMQRAVGASMIFAAKHYGSRGSAFVIGEGSFLDRKPVKEEEAGRERVLVTRESGEEILVSDRPRRPIPERELWFEKVWNAYNEERKRT